MSLPSKPAKQSPPGYFPLASFSIIMMIAVYLVATGELSPNLRTIAFGSIILVYLGLFALIFIRQNKFSSHSKKTDEEESNAFTAEIEEKLLVLEEASQFFSASLKSVDMFRLVAGRIEELVPFSICAFFLIDETKTQLKITYAIGEKAAQMKNVMIDISRGLAGKAFLSRKAQRDESLVHDKSAMSPAALKGLKSSIAVPLKRETEIFGVIQLYADTNGEFNDNSLSILEAIGERVASLLAGSLAFEQSLSNAITDSLTNLPNERAFYLMLENQIAEAERLTEKRNLSVLAMDIKNFAELNKRYGHSTGDLMLVTAAKIINNQLRQMDFLSRSLNDEFLAVLPTAGEEITQAIILRIETAFIANPFIISEKEKVDLQLNFGAATFSVDGDTAQKLLQVALLKKQQSKKPKENQVIFFPKEFVN